MKPDWMDFNDAPPLETVAFDPEERRERIRFELLARLDSVLLTLLPAGKVRGGTFAVGDVRGQAGDSLEVALEGERAGLWIDRATGEGGDIFDLIACHLQVNPRLEFGRVLAYAEDLLGLTPSATDKPTRRKKSVAVDDLGPYTAKWDYLAADGSLLACVYRFDPPDRRKEFRPWDAKRQKDTAPNPRPLYNLPGIATAQTIVLVEGEKCAQTLIAIGVCATTAMHGANAPVDKTDWTPLVGKSLVIWPDKDKPGWDYALRAGHAGLAAGALCCAILFPPEDRPEGWDVADAIVEGFDVEGFLADGDRITLQPDTPPKVGSLEPDDEHAVWATEDALALNFTRRYAHDWRYVAQWGQWLVWTGTRWQAEQTLCAQHLIRQVCRDAALQADSFRTAAKLASSGAVTGVERMARTDRRHAATADEWDADPWLLNTPGGVMVLKTGISRQHRREDRMTRITTATPRGACPTWLRFLETATGGNRELQDYLARMAGYTLTGSTREHALFFLYGTGANGKSVFLNTLTSILGDYATNAPMETFMETRSDRHPTDMAGLRGARLVSSIETEQGRRWAESKLKALTGGDKVSARFMRQDFFEYLPQFKLVIAGNHKPSIRNVDEAMRRRLHMIPFTVTIPPARRDHDLPKKLLSESDGILAWMVAGCLEWQRRGLQPPQCVVDATEEYFEAEDALGRWIEERCFVDVNARATVADLYADWKEWADAAGEYAGSIRRFSDQLISRKFEKWRSGTGARGFLGLSLRPKSYNTHYSDRED